MASGTTRRMTSDSARRTPRACTLAATRDDLMRVFSTAKLLIALLLLASFAPGCTTLTGRSTGRYVDDQSITGKVKARLTQDKASNFTRIAVKTIDGVVYLEGVVDSEADRATAENIARGVPEAMQVVNQLQVSAPPSALPR